MSDTEPTAPAPSVKLSDAVEPGAIEIPSTASNTPSPEAEKSTPVSLFVYPNGVLRNPAEEVTDFAEAKEIGQRLVGLLLACRGAVGLSAPQIGVAKQVVVVNLSRKPEDNIVLVNPVVTETSEDTWVHGEGCLSFPGVTVRVERPCRATVKAKTFEGKDVELALKGMACRVVLHEIDHLSGVLLYDHASKLKRGMIERKMKKFRKRARRRRG